MNASITLTDHPDAQRFEADVDGAQAFATYQMDAKTMTFTHTEVPEALRGRGIGSQLVKAALQAARDGGLHVVPQCPMFAAYMRAHPETQDLLTPAARAQL